IIPCRPALVPLVFNADDRERFTELAGVSTDVIASSDGQQFREKMLFTHRGLSGPAILQISSYWKPGDAIALDLAPDENPVLALREGNATRDIASLRTALRSALPTRFADRWLDL